MSFEADRQPAGRRSGSISLSPTTFIITRSIDPHIYPIEGPAPTDHHARKYPKFPAHFSLVAQQLRHSQSPLSTHSRPVYILLNSFSSHRIAHISASSGSLQFGSHRQTERATWPLLFLMMTPALASVVLTRYEGRVSICGATHHIFTSLRAC